MAIAPADRQNWVLANILPVLLVCWLVRTRRLFPLSSASYLLIAVYLTLHTTGVHYTYAETPIGTWGQQFFGLERNHFDRLVHFCFGLLLTYPLYEFFGRQTQVRGWVLAYLPVMTILGWSAVWEMIEAAVAQVVHPELGMAFVGFQGDLWDAQQDMAMALLGALLCLALMWLAGSRARPRPRELDSCSIELSA